MLNIEDRKVKVLVICGVLLIAAIGAFWMLSAKTLDSHECFVSVAAREMLKRNDWVMPTLNGSLRLQKTPLCYWLVAIAAKITGTIDEFTARLPRAVFFFLSAGMMLYFLRKWLPLRTAAVATCVWLTSMSYIRFAQNPRSDTVMSSFMLLCFFTFYAAINTQNRKEQIVYMLIFWVSMSLGNLAKGPAPLPLVLFPLFCYVAANKLWKFIPKLLPITGPVIMLAIILPWPLVIAQRVNWDLVLWKREFFDRFFGEYVPGHYPIFYYFLIMFKYIVPWVIFVPIALCAPFFKVWEEKQRLMKYLWMLFAAGFIFLTIDQGKRQHYILPYMPALAILIGITLDDMIFTRKAYTAIFSKNILKLHLTGLAVGAVGAVVYIAARYRSLAADTGIVAGIAIAMIIVIAIFFSKRKFGLGAIGIFGGIIIWYMVYYGMFWSYGDDNLYAREFAQTAARIVPPSDKLVFYKAASSRFVQYFGRPVHGKDNISELYELYKDGYWIGGFSIYSEELVKDGRFRVVYQRQVNVNKKEKEDAGGILCNKSATPVKNANTGN